MPPIGLTFVVNIIIWDPLLFIRIILSLFYNFVIPLLSLIKPVKILLPIKLADLDTPILSQVLGLLIIGIFGEVGNWLNIEVLLGWIFFNLAKLLVELCGDEIMNLDVTFQVVQDYVLLS